jgi:hypothetical protein
LQLARFPSVDEVLLVALGVGVAAEAEDDDDEGGADELAELWVED